MRDVDARLEEILEAAGARWRASLPSARTIDPSMFVAKAARRGGWPWSFAAGAATATVVLVGLALALGPMLLSRTGSGGAVTSPGPGSSYLSAGLEHCPLTRPDRSFTPPPQAGVDWDVAPGRAWYGSARLWTLLDVDGERWTGLPKSDLGLTQKTFWWRAGYDSIREPRPEVYVTGRRLDGPGRLGFGPGTNAGFGLGSAMLVGVEIPEPGCWELTARYGSDRLSIVVWVGG